MCRLCYTEYVSWFTWFMRCRSQWTKDHLSPSSSVLCKCQHEAQPRSVDISTEERTIPVRHSRGPLGLTLTLALTLITPGMADPRNGGPVPNVQISTSRKTTLFCTAKWKLVFRWSRKYLHHFMTNLFRITAAKFRNSSPHFVDDITKTIVDVFYRLFALKLSMT